MAHLLISNFTPDTGGVYHLDTDDGRLDRLTTHPARGLTWGPDGVYVMGTRGAVHRLVPGTGESRLVAETGLLGAHDLRWSGDGFLAVASESNEVVRLGPDLTRLESFRVVEGDGDICHANCVLEVNGELLLTIFTLSPGPRKLKNETDAWKYEGKVLRLEWERRESVVLYEPLAQPHSLLWRDGQLYVCESFTSELAVLDLAKKRKRRLCRLHGFVRGLAFAGGRGYVGISGWKHRRPWLQEMRDRGRMPCGVVELDPETWRPLREFPVPGEQVYDILVLEAP